MYIAKHYVRVNGKMYTRGEAIPDGLSADKVAWLMESGAIEEFAPGQAAAAPETATATQPEPETEPAVETPPEEVDEEADVPEIDAMAGIIAGEQEEAPKKTTRKTATKKTTERRKSK